ncbi:MAG: copper-binding protein [Gemmataceae bacterium]|nr:copper-binding protein [Gemmataceae bacterium]
MKLRCLPVLVVSLLALAGCQKPADTQKPGTTAEEKEYDIKGTVVDVASDKKAVTLDHEQIPELNMMAMKMKYPVSDPKVLDGIAAGDKVSGRLKAKGTDYTITKLEKR